MKSVDEQLAILKRGVAEIITEEELRRKLERSLKTNRAQRNPPPVVSGRSAPQRRNLHPTNLPHP
jgi:hypothetical protein